MSQRTRNSRLSEEKLTKPKNGFSEDDRKQLSEINTTVKGLVKQIKNLCNELEATKKELMEVKHENLKIKQMAYLNYGHNIYCATVLQKWMKLSSTQTADERMCECMVFLSRPVGNTLATRTKMINRETFPIG